MLRSQAQVTNQQLGRLSKGEKAWHLGKVPRSRSQKLLSQESKEGRATPTRPRHDVRPEARLAVRIEHQALQAAPPGLSTGWAAGSPTGQQSCILQGVRARAGHSLAFGI